MLRRNPTAITITSEDIAAFEDARLRRLEQQQNSTDTANATENRNTFANSTNSNNNNTSGVIDPNDELKPLPGDKARIVRTRDERIGVGSARARRG
jgi:hypothetical protein